MVDLLDAELEFTTKIRNKGEVTIPKAIREVLDLQVGEHVTVKVRRPEK